MTAIYGCRTRQRITVLALEVRPTMPYELVTEFEYRQRDGVLILWHVTVSEDHDIDDINGECDSAR
jgi:hypothetical protein